MAYDDEDGTYGSDAYSDWEEPMSEDDYAPTGSSSRKRRTNTKGKAKASAVSRKKQKKDVVIPVVAKVTVLATDALETAEATQGELARERLEKADKAIVDRIKKALALANHEGTGEAEARAALRMATKYMQMHNISQADVLAAENDAQKLKRAGQSVVTITSNPDLPSKSVLFSSWTAHLAYAMTIFFDCRYYSTTWSDKSRITWTFYGLAEQTVAAATAFEICHNLILTWSAQNTEAKGRNGKNNYCHGVADGLTSMAHRERKEEEQKAIAAEVERLASAKREEAETRKTELTRLEGPNLPDHEDAKVKPEPDDIKPVLRDKEMDEEEEEDVKGEKPGVKVEEVPDEDEPHRPTSTRPLPDFSNRLFDEERFNFPNGAGIESDDDSDNDVGNGFGEGYSHERDADFVEGDDVDDLLDLESAEPKVKVKPEPIDDEVIKPRLSSSEDDRKEPTPVKPEPVEPEASWQSEGQLIQFRNDAGRIADQFLESQKDKHGKPMKLKTGRPTAGVNIKDAAGYKAYRKGKEDAKNIDVKRKRIKDTNEDN